MLIKGNYEYLYYLLWAKHLCLNLNICTCIFLVCIWGKLDKFYFLIMSVIVLDVLVNIRSSCWCYILFMVLYFMYRFWYFYIKSCLHQVFSCKWGVHWTWPWLGLTELIVLQSLEQITVGLTSYTVGIQLIILQSLAVGLNPCIVALQFIQFYRQALAHCFWWTHCLQKMESICFLLDEVCWITLYTWLSVVSVEGNNRI